MREAMISRSGNTLSIGVLNVSTTIHAEVNGAYNIVRKAYPDAFTKSGIPVKLYPRRINVSINEIRKKSPDICRVRRKPYGLPLLQEPGGQVSLHRARASRTRPASPRSQGNLSSKLPVWR